MILVLLAIVVASLLTISNNKPLSRSDEFMIEKAVASLEHLTATNIMKIERIQGRRVRVHTRDESGNGGDLLELQEKDGKWVLQKRGAWMN